MILKIYQILWFFFPFLIKKRLIKKSKKSIAYLNFWEERFGKAYHNPVKDCIWIHAVSVGETQAAEPVIHLLRSHYPETPFLITQMTPTGRAIAEKLFPFAQCRYLPYDKKKYVWQFITEHQPKIALILETEIWPNLLLGLKKKSIPIFLLNARLSKKSYSGYLKIRRLTYPAIRCFTKIFAQSENDLNFFKQLGCQNIEVVGNSKYDIQIKAESIQLADTFKNYIQSSKPIIVCGSTRVKNKINEAYIILEEWKKHAGSALLLIVPRHPEYFQSVYDYAVKMGFKTVKRSENPIITPEIDVVIGDSMGELIAYYLCADIVFVGGTLVDTGGQNIIEPISCQKPTIFGYSTFNFAKICQDALDFGCAIQVHNLQEWSKQIDWLIHHSEFYDSIQKKCYEFILKHQGASQKMVSEIVKLFEKGFN